MNCAVRTGRKDNFLREKTMVSGNAVGWVKNMA